MEADDVGQYAVNSIVSGEDEQCHIWYGHDNSNGRGKYYIVVVAMVEPFPRGENAKKLKGEAVYQMWHSTTRSLAVLGHQQLSSWISSMLTFPSKAV
jgi:hypothetical protein